MNNTQEAAAAAQAKKDMTGAFVRESFDKCVTVIHVDNVVTHNPVTGAMEKRAVLAS